MNQKNDNYELSSLRYGEFCVLIEFCSNCQEHNNSLRHDPQKYQEKALFLKEQIQNEFPFIKIYLKPLQTQIKENIKRLGLFEVNFGSYEKSEWTLVGSKLKTLKWPNEKIVLNNIRSQFQGKTIQVQLEHENIQFHPSNNFKSHIKTMLVSELDYPQIIKRINLKEKKQRKNVASSFLKTRKISSIVRSKIQSGIIQENELKELLENKQVVSEQIPNHDFGLQFVNVKPGRYKFLILQNKNLKFQSLDLRVDPPLRQDDQIQKEKVNLKFVQHSNVKLFIQQEVSCPIIRVFLKLKEKDQLEEELIQEETIKRNKKLTAVFKANNIRPGLYEFYVEYRDDSKYHEDIEIYQGTNQYVLEYPSLELALDFKNTKKIKNKEEIKPKVESPIKKAAVNRDENQPVNTKQKITPNYDQRKGQEKKVKPLQESIREIEKLENSFEDEFDENFEKNQNVEEIQKDLIKKSSTSESKLPGPVRSDRDHQVSRPEIQEAEKKSNFSFTSYSSKNSNLTRKSKISSVSKKSEQEKNQNSKKFQSKEFDSSSKKSESRNFTSVSKKTESNDFETNSKKSESKNSQSESSSKKSETSKSKSSHTQSNKDKIYPNSNQRITSGNKIRPGERLYSAKSNQMNQGIGEEQPQKVPLIQRFQCDQLRDGVWETLEKDENCFSLYINNNDCVELDHDFIGDQLMAQDLGEVMVNVTTENFQAFCIYFFKEFQLGRFFLKKLKPKIEEDVVVYLSNNRNVYKINVKEYFNYLTKEDETYSDLCLISKDFKDENYQEHILLVPLVQELNSTTGLLEIKNLVNFVSNSKFGVAKFFGFDIEEAELGNKDFTLQEDEVISSLKNYEIHCDSNYLVNAMRYDSSGKVSMKKIVKVYPIFKKLISNIDYIIEQMEEQLEGDEEFPVDEFDDDFQIISFELILKIKQQIKLIIHRSFCLKLLHS